MYRYYEVGAFGHMLRITFLGQRNDIPSKMKSLALFIGLILARGSCNASENKTMTYGVSFEMREGSVVPSNTCKDIWSLSSGRACSIFSGIFEHAGMFESLQRRS